MYIAVVHSLSFLYGIIFYLYIILSLLYHWWIFGVVTIILILIFWYISFIIYNYNFFGTYLGVEILDNRIYKYWYFIYNTILPSIVTVTINPPIDSIQPLYFLFFTFLLNLLRWHWLNNLYRFQVHNATSHHLYPLLCVHHPKSNLCASPFIPPTLFSTSPHLFPWQSPQNSV